MSAKKSVRNKAQLAALLRLVRPIVGQRCWSARLAYADELKLDIGDKIPYRSPKLKGLLKGCWRFNACGGDWKLESPEATVSSRSKRPRIEAALKKLVGDITAVTVGYRQLSLALGFADGSKLTISHRAGQPTYDLPYWEIFTPDGKIIQAGPGRRWLARSARARARR